MSEFRMAHMTLGPVGTNCYIVWNEDSREAFVVDPADNGPAIMTKLRTLNINLKAILLTHGHFDHMMAAPYLKKATGAPIYAGEHENVILTDAEANLSGAWVGMPTTFEADHYLKDGEEFDLCGFHFRNIETPGHTIGGVCYYLEAEGQLFCGDTLFCNSYGRTDLPTGRARTLMKSLNDKLFTLPDEVVAYPGHDRSTTIGHEKKYNPAAYGGAF